jgi:hypothetical protein
MDSPCDKTSPISPCRSSQPGVMGTNGEEIQDMGGNRESPPLVLAGPMDATMISTATAFILFVGSFCSVGCNFTLWADCKCGEKFLRSNNWIGLLSLDGKPHPGYAPGLMAPPRPTGLRYGVANAHCRNFCVCLVRLPAVRIGSRF